MTDRRPGPPLFELLGQDQPEPDDSREHSGGGDDAVGGVGGVDGGVSEPAVSGGVSGGGSGGISAGVSRAERSAAMVPEEVPQGEGVVQLTMSRVYLLVALVFLSWVLVWVGAYKLGLGDGRSEMEGLIDTPSVVLPPVEGEYGGVRGGVGDVVEEVDVVVDEGVFEPPRVPAQAVEAVMSAQGYLELDPRVSGNNYLQLATLPAEQAADAVLYMNDHGISIIGVPVVDSGVRAGNNPSRYTLYSLGLAVPGGAQFRAMESQRNEHKRMIARLGGQWQRERRGGSDFGESKTQWVKYN